MNAAASALGMIYATSEIALGIRKRARAEGARVADRGSLALLWIVIGGSAWLAFSLGAASVAAAVKIVGALVFAAGLAIRWYAINYLGRFFTVNVAIAADHRLIDDGPYRRIRHPSYAGALLAFLGLGVTLGSWASLALLTVPMFLVFSWRMRVEEQALLEGLGDPYRRFMRRTKRLIPSVY